MNLQPLSDRIIVKKAPVEEVTKSGIFLGAAQPKQTATAKVAAIGSNVKLVAIGDTILFNKYSGVEIDSDHMIMKEDEILAIENK